MKWFTLAAALTLSPSIFCAVPKISCSNGRYTGFSLHSPHKPEKDIIVDEFIYDSNKKSFVMSFVNTKGSELAEIMEGYFDLNPGALSNPFVLEISNLSSSRCKRAALSSACQDDGSPDLAITSGGKSLVSLRAQRLFFVQQSPDVSISNTVMSWLCDPFNPPLVKPGESGHFRGDYPTAVAMLAPVKDWEAKLRSNAFPRFTLDFESCK